MKKAKKTTALEMRVEELENIVAHVLVLLAKQTGEHDKFWTVATLSTALDISPKTLRQWLRENYGETHEKYARWGVLSEETVNKARERFLGSRIAAVESN